MEWDARKLTCVIPTVGMGQRLSSGSRSGSGMGHTQSDLSYS